MNLDFNYVKYLNEIASSGLNITRTFSGIYVEPSGAFGIEKNTLAPAPESTFVCGQEAQSLDMPTVATNST